MTVLAEFIRALTFRAGHNSAVATLSLALLGVAAGIVGVYALLRKRSLLSDAVSHAGLPGVCVAFLLAGAIGAPTKSLALLLAGAAVFGALAALAVHALAAVPRLKPDAAIGAALSVYFAVGVVLLTYIQARPTGDQAGLQSFILGQAAALGRDDALRIAIACAVVAILALLLHKEMRAVCFDAAFTRAIGWRVGHIDALMLAMIVAVAVLGMQSVGALLIVAMLITPAAAARFWTERMSAMLLVGALVGALSGWIGAALSAALPAMPTGPVVVCAAGALFVISLLAAPRRGLVAHALRIARTRRLVSTEHLRRALFELDERARAADRAVHLDDLVAMRSWPRARVRRLLRRAARAGEITLDGDTCALTPRGRAEANRVARNHRLWEHYLITHADVAPSHVDRTADLVEHVLGDELVARLEAALTHAGEAPPTRTTPDSPHAITATGTNNKVGA